jgi:hypothetical protein
MLGWYPDIKYFSNFTISAGDVIKHTLSVFSTTSGEARIDNLTNGNTASESLNSSIPLCLQGAEWTVEGLLLNVPLIDFGTVAFVDAVVGGIAGTYTPSRSDATLYNIEQNNQLLTSISANGSSVTIKYV